MLPFKTCTIFVLLTVVAWPQEIRWRFENHYDDVKTYIHTVANYEMHPLWYERWENDQFRGNLLRLNFGSISQADLFSDARLVVNEKVAPGLWFRYATTYYATHHRNEHDVFASLGFEKSLYKSVAVFINGNPHFEKEEIDVFYGLSLTNKARTNYARVAFVDIDPFWSDKNDQGGLTLKRPWQVQWQANMRAGAWRFFSEGWYDAGLARQFETESDYAAFYQRKKIDDQQFKLYFYPTAVSFVEVKFHTYNFDEAKHFKAGEQNYAYHNHIDIFKLGYFTPLSQKWRVRFGAHYVRQRAESIGFRAHRYSRRELLPYFFAEMAAGPGLLEIGYIGSLFSWNYDGLKQMPPVKQDEFVDKIKLAYTFNYSDRAYFQLAVSHVTTVWGFGGGNVQFWLEF